MLLQDAEHNLRRRPIRQQHARRADRHRKRHGVAKSVGEEQLGDRIDKVVLADAEAALPAQPRGLHWARVHVAHALGHAGRAGRVEPKRRLVAAGIDGFVIGRLVLQLGAQRQSERRCLAAGDEDVLEERQLPKDRLHHRQQRGRDEQRLGAAVTQDVGVLLGCQEGVERDRNHAGLDRTPERDGKIDRVVQQQRHARFAGDAIGVEQIGHAVAAGLQLAVSQRLVGIDEGWLRRPALRHVAIDHVDRRIVNAWIGHRSSLRPSRAAYSIAIPCFGGHLQHALHHTASLYPLKAQSFAQIRPRDVVSCRYPDEAAWPPPQRR
jgi:hypothetical protein